VALAQAREDEAEAKLRRISREQAIIDFVDFRLPEGQQTYTIPDGSESRCKVVVKQPISSTFDSKAWPFVRESVHPDARLAVRTKYEIDTKVARTIQKDMPTEWRRIAKLLTRSPGKVSVVIQEIETEHAS